MESALKNHQLLLIKTSICTTHATANTNKMLKFPSDMKDCKFATYTGEWALEISVFFFFSGVGKEEEEKKEDIKRDMGLSEKGKKGSPHALQTVLRVGGTSM